MSEDLNKAKNFFFESLDLQFNGNLDAAKNSFWYPSIRILKQKVLNNWQREIDIIKRYIKLKSNYKL
jgi:hypothetical protein